MILTLFTFGHLAVLSILGSIETECPRKSLKFDCYGAGPYSDTVKVCDLSYQICQYEWNLKPKCSNRPHVAVICNSTNELVCTCQYDETGYPSCGCAEKSVLKRLSLYSWIGIAVCIVLIIICGSIFMYCFIKRRKERLNRPPQDNSENESAPPPYETAVMLTQSQL